MLRQYTRVQFFLEEGIRCVGLVSVSWVLWGCALLRAPASCLLASVPSSIQETWVATSQKMEGYFPSLFMVVIHPTSLFGKVTCPESSSHEGQMDPKQEPQLSPGLRLF